MQTLYSHFLTSTGICTDTRKIEKGNLFFALKGPNFNGNQYAEMALKKGAAFAIVDEQIYAKDERYILVEDALTTLQKLANYHRKQLNIPVIGIAGSNGKTTTKELMYAVLSQKYKTFATKGNLNNHIGVPLTLLSIDKTIEMAILELGANHVGELELLCQIAEPNYGIITNNGLDHLEGYGSFEGVVQGNSELYYWLLKNNGTPFVNSTDEVLVRMASRFKSTITYGNENDFFNAKIFTNEFFIQLKTDEDIAIQTQLIGEYNLDNINAALCIGKFFEVDSKDAAKAIEEYLPANNRSQLLQKGTNSIVLDCYNANPSSMQKSVESFSKLKASNKILMLGDMFELGDYSASEHQKMVEFCENLGFETVYFCGEAFSNCKLKITTYQLFPNRTELETHLSIHKPENTSILIKGSRGMTMEKLVDYL